MIAAARYPLTKRPPRQGGRLVSQQGDYRVASRHDRRKLATLLIGGADRGSLRFGKYEHRQSMGLRIVVGKSLLSIGPGQALT
jgi:hypothetical protein